MVIRNPRYAEIEPRRTQLAKMTKGAVLQIWRDGHGRGHIWSAVSPSRWTKEELIGDILCYEIGAIDLCGEAGPDGARCSIQAGTVHVTHRYTIPAGTEVEEVD